MNFTDLFFSYGAYLFVIVINGLAIFLAHKNKDNIIKIIIIINFFLFIVLFDAYGNVIPYIYFIFCLGRWIYHKFKQ